MAIMSPCTISAADSHAGHADISLMTSQQDKIVVTGIVTDSNGEPLIGVNVLEKGTANGVITGLDGDFTLSVSGSESVLVFSYIGYKEVTVRVGSETSLSISMSEDTQQIDEVVVTALGIKREKKMLGYAVQDIKGEKLNATGDPLVTSMLSGKVAGLQMNTAGTGLGGSTKITLRGNSSLTDNNQPLWIIDGVPFNDNSSSDASLFGGVDRGGGAVDINPDDIESISVLKGPNAAALYGSRAGNGVILITTKKGVKDKGFGVTYSGNFTWTSVASTLEMQDKYGQGTQGVFDETSQASFGGLLDGHDYTGWLGQPLQYKKYGDKLKDYFDTGFSQTHNVAIGKSTENSNYRASFGSTESRGMFNDERLSKINIDLRGGMKMNKYLSMDSKVSLVAYERFVSADDEEEKASFLGALNMERGIYEDHATMYAPYYRQMTFPLYLGSEEDAAPYIAIAYEDIEDAFMYYLENENEGRPFILAGFSQGAQLVLMLIENLFDDPELSDSLIAAYCIGWRITEEDLEEYPQLKMAEREDDTGVIVSFNSESVEADGSIIVPEGMRTIGINPLNWKTDSTFADKELNEGACFTDYSGSIVKEIPHLTGAYLDPGRGTLKAVDILPEEYSISLFPDGVYHLYDYQFFFRNLEENVGKRIASWYSR